MLLAPGKLRVHQWVWYPVETRCMMCPKSHFLTGNVAKFYLQ